MSMFGGADRTKLVVEALKLSGQRGLLADGEGTGNTEMVSKDVLRIHALPHDWLFPQMAAIVHHGGAGTTGTALRAGKPMVICPFVGDQTFWGYRVATLGVGPAPIPKGRLTVESLANAIRRAVSDEEMRQRAAALGEIIRREDGVNRAVARINRHLENRQ